MPRTRQMTRTRALSRLHPHVIGDQSLTKMEYIFKVLQAMSAAVHDFPGPSAVLRLKSPPYGVFLVFEESGKQPSGDVRVGGPIRVVDELSTQTDGFAERLIVRTTR